MQMERQNQFGTADALLRVLYLRKDWGGEKFTVRNSDNLYYQHVLEVLLKTEYKNAMIEYDRSALEFEEERIKRFAIILKNENGSLAKLIEKTSKKEIDQLKNQSEKFGVSMNIFAFSYSQIVSVLPEVPLHPVRDENEILIAVNIPVEKYPGLMKTYYVSEHVPDLTKKEDIIPIQKSLDSIYKNTIFD